MVYVDGANLYWGLHDKSKRRDLWLDLVALARELRPRSRLVGVRYFVAPVVGEPEAQSRQAHYWDALRALHPNMVRLVEGRYQTKPMRCLRCGASWDHREEKETDVNIAVSLVADAARGAMDSALLISGDSDLAPAVRTVREFNQSIFVAAAFPPSRFSSELKSLMRASFVIGIDKVRKSQLPDTFEAAGRTFQRPARWS